MCMHMCIQNCEEFSIHQRAVLPFRGTSTAWRKRQSPGTLWSSAKGFAKPYTWGQITSSTGCAGGQMGWKAALLCWWTSWPWASCVLLQQRGSTASWAVLGSTWPADQGRRFFTSTQHWWDHITSRSGLPRYKKWMYWSRPSKRLWGWLRYWKICHVQRTRELWLLRSWNLNFSPIYLFLSLEQLYIAWSCEHDCSHARSS